MKTYYEIENAEPKRIEVGGWLKDFLLKQKDGITGNTEVLIYDALAARELIKVNTLETSPLTAREAAEKLAALAKAGDAVLVKGSHYTHMEKVPMLLRGVLN